MSMSSAVLSCLDMDLAASKLRVYPRLSAEQNAQVSAYASKTLREKLFSKLKPSVPDASADNAAISNFLAVNQRMRDFRILDMQLMEWEHDLYGTFKRAVDSFFHPDGDPLLLGLEQILAHGSLGAGSNTGSRGTDFYTKLFSSPLACTSESLYCAYDQWTKLSPLWGSAEKARSSRFGVSIVKHSALTCVPKNVAISRVIGVEPSLNMFYQLGLGMILRIRLKKVYGIDLRVQPEINRRLALVGSRSNCIATTDLESASDRNSRALVRDVVPFGQYAFLDLLSTKSCVLPDASEHELGMISMMGNGFTFPLQTVLFSCMVEAAYRFTKREFRRSGGDWSVFGDDIICHRDVVRPLHALLRMCGHVVNTAKTFVEGPFRESCGSDFYNGQSVRPVYIKSLATQEARYVAINRLVEWSSIHDVPLTMTIKYLLSTVKWLPVTIYHGYDAGVRVPFNLADGLKLNGNGSFIVRFRKPRAPSLIVKGDVIVVPNGEKARMMNPDGLFVAVLQGCVRGDKIGVRANCTAYSTRSAVAPSWCAAVSSALDVRAWRRWVDAATGLLTSR